MMNFSYQKIMEIYSHMLVNGATLYGAGARGRSLAEHLSEKGFRVVAVGDREAGKICGGCRAVSLEEFCEKKVSEVCIITPAEPLPDVCGKLRQHYRLVIDPVDLERVFEWMECFIPRDDSELRYHNCHPFNHYESPFIQKKELEFYRKNENADKLLDIDFNLDVQRNFLPALQKYTAEFFQMQQKCGNAFRYRSDNGWFDDSDARLLHGMIREHHPKRIIEIGSGYSTCVMLDTNEYWMDNSMEITCIEPYPERLLKNIRSGDRLKIKKNFVQEIPLEEFGALEKNDILFIDSSHVVKTGGDVPWEYFNIIPTLKDGVLIHIHDIVYPFTYPERWILEGRAYTETYILRAFLMNNSKYEILFFNSMMGKLYREEYAAGWDQRRKMTGGSIWLRKCVEY